MEFGSDWCYSGPSRLIFKGDWCYSSRSRENDLLQNQVKFSENRDFLPLAVIAIFLLTKKDLGL